MEKIIQTIIQSAIPNGSIFDAHSIINYLEKYHNDIYKEHFQLGWTTAFYHSQISRVIATFEGSTIKRQGESWSKNINNDFNLNICWIKS